MKVKRYKRGDAVSYSLGGELTIELLRRLPDNVKCIFLHPDFRDGAARDMIYSLCSQNGIEIEVSEKPFNILSQKENCFVIGAFSRFERKLDPEGSHVVLVNPSNAGNMGTIIRTALGFGVNNLAVITPAVDFFDPKTVRASMGASFGINFEEFPSFDDYAARFPNHSCYPFMLNAKHRIGESPFVTPASLIFGNEATGLPDSFSRYESIVIPHTNAIDSLNLPIAASIAIYELCRK